MFFQLYLEDIFSSLLFALDCHVEETHLSVTLSKRWAAVTNTRFTFVRFNLTFNARTNAAALVKTLSNKIIITHRHDVCLLAPEADFDQTLRKQHWFDSRWPLQLFDLSKHNIVYKSVSFTAAELKFDVAERQPQNVLWTLTDMRSLFIILACKAPGIPSSYASFTSSLFACIKTICARCAWLKSGGLFLIAPMSQLEVMGGVPYIS